MVSLLLAAGLALVHLGAGKLRFLTTVPRSRWLSFASGISVAYVFVHLLPELAEGQEALAEAEVFGGVVEEGHIWLMALLGLAAFYGLERAAKASREANEQGGEGDETEPGVFWLHTVSFALYNVLVGYLLGRSGVGAGLGTFWFAMALHFFVNDYGLRQDHKDQYSRVGRWVLAVAVVGGTALGLAVDVHEAVLAGLVAFLGGGVVLNVLKEELPEERESRFVPFALGTAAYAALLTVV